MFDANIKTPEHAIWRPGSIRVLQPADNRPAPAGEVIAVSPLLGAYAAGTLDKGALDTMFIADARDSNNNVLVVPAGTRVTLVKPSAADVQAIRARLLKLEAFGPGVKAALSGLEIGAVDFDGDGRADAAVTYGCAWWGEGHCQAHGQLFLARKGERWSEIE